MPPQQAAEKVIRALFIPEGVRPHCTHDITALLSVLADNRIIIPEPVWAAALATHASAARYPGSGSGMTKEEYHDSLTLAGGVILRAEGLV